MHFLEVLGLVGIIVYLSLLFTREKYTKKDYTFKVVVFVLIGLASAMVSVPLYGPIFGFTSIILSSVILATLVEFKSKS